MRVDLTSTSPGLADKAFLNAVKPNFFLVGAPKCGTTSLYAYLSEHPQVYLPKVKEPQFFCTDFEKFRAWTKVNTLEKYAKLYSRVPERCSVVGDASTFYLFSKHAVRLAYEFNPSARFLVMLRNPVDMAHSLHGHYVYRGREDVWDFEAAWRLQDARARGENLPRPCLSAEQLQYRDVCRLGEQLERLLSVVPREQVKVFLLEDMKASPKAVYEAALEFLGLPSDGRETFLVLNESRRHRLGFLGRTIMKAPFPLSILRGAMSASVRLKVGEHFHKWFSRPLPRAPLRPEFRKELAMNFREDVAKLESLLGRDLSLWKEDAPKTPATAGAIAFHPEMAGCEP